MSNENENTTKKGAALTEKVAKYKLIARDSLRMALISPRLSRIAGLEDTLASLAKTKTEVDHEILVENYEISKLDTNHPNYEKTKTRKEETVKNFTSELESLAKQVEEVNKSITEQKEAITKIENGETKVSLDALNDLVDEMLRNDAVTKVS
jgi:chromosome segregation ATPase